MKRKKVAKKKVVKKRKVKGDATKVVGKQAYNPQAIVGFTIRKLFGYLDYNLSAEASGHHKLGRLAILYGLNGTGKTTILKLAYNLISPTGRRGHKTFIARTQFKLFRIIFLDGSTVSAEREKATTGSFSISVSRPRRKTVSYHLRASFDEKVAYIDREVQQEEGYQPVIRNLEDLSSTFFFIADNRSIDFEYHETPGSPPFGDTIYFERYLSSIARPFGERRAEESSVAVAVALEAAMRSLHQCLSMKVNLLSSTGVASTHSVYADVMKQIVSPAKQKRDVLKATLNEKIIKLRSLALESRFFEEYGLSSELDVEPLVRTLGQATTGYKRRTLSKILTVYLEGLENRFNELRPIYETIDSLIKCLNNFLSPKKVRFRLDEGLTLFAPNGEQLREHMLSSGERHLLLILCCTLILGDQPAIFIVDEPEISLNIVWQRKLLKALLEISKDSKVQFVMASHSMHLISHYMDHIVRLSPKKKLKRERYVNGTAV